MAKHHDDTYVAQLAATLELAAEFRIPCPGHPYGVHADLRVSRRTDAEQDTWSIGNGDAPEQVWTGDKWAYRCDLTREQQHPYTRDQAITEALRIAPLETAAFLDHIKRLRAEAQKEDSRG